MPEKIPVKHTPPNCVADGCRKQPNKISPQKIPACQYCCNDVDEIKRRKALPLVKGPDGLRRKYLGIKGANSGDES